MHRLPIAVVVAVSTFAITQIASAADFSVKAPIAVAAPTWTGFYIGGNAGYSWGHTHVDYSETAGLLGFGSSLCRFGCSLPFTMEPSGFAGGLQLGLNYQTGMWVWGVEADFAWRSPEATHVSFLDPPFQDTLTLTDKQDWFGTVRGRIGFTQGAAQNWLIYLTGGLAYGKFEHSITQFCNIFCNETVIFSDSQRKTGWTLGGGVEVALDPNWSVGAEYLYMDFGTDTLNSAGNGSVIPATTVSFHDRSQVARFKVNYRFGM